MTQGFIQENERGKGVERAGDTAVLEFETSMQGKYVNGVDIIRCNDAGKIIEFRVMIRPLQAVNQVHANMKAMLERLGMSF